MNQKAINDGGCAYPITIDFTGPSTNPLTGKPIAANHTDRHIDLGLTKRDQFAISALQSGHASQWRDNDYIPVDGLSIIENTALCAYRFADAMMKARES